MARIALIVFGILVLIVGGLAVAASLIPTETYKAEIEKQVEQQTGRKLTIEGDVGITFLPSIGAEAEKVRFANAEWGSSPDMVTMESLQVALKILPLLSGNVEISRFILVEPEINLEVNGQGTPNWQFAPMEQAAEAAPGEAAPAEEEAPAASEESSGGSGIGDISLGEVSIENGAVSYRDQQSGAVYELTQINTTLDLPSLDAPMNFDGSAVWNGDEVNLTLTAENPRVLIAGGTTAFTLDLSAPKVTTSFDGSINQGDQPKLGGEMSVDIPSVRELAAWAGSPLPEGDGFGPFNITGKVSATPEVFDFSDAELAFDGMNGTGALNADLRGQKPKITGRLDVDKIDTNIYMAGAPASSGGGDTASGGGSGGGTAPAASSEGWSDEPIDMSALNAFNADLALSAGEILIQKIQIGESALGVKLNNGVLTADLSKLALYEGAGTAKVTLNGASATPALNATFDLSGLSAYPLLRDAADFERLEGNAAMNVSVDTRGKSQKQMISALNGSGEMRFTDGAIKGINVAQLMRNVFSGALTGWNSAEAKDTDFSELGGTFTISNGILSNQDFLMLSPLIRVAGKGTVNLPQKTLSYRVEPKLAATLEGQGGETGSKGIEVPVMIEGPWAKPRFTPDLKAILSDPDGALNTIKDMDSESGKQLLEGLMGGGSSSGSSSEEDGEKKNLEDAVKGLFGR